MHKDGKTLRSGNLQEQQCLAVQDKKKKKL